MAKKKKPTMLSRKGKSKPRPRVEKIVLAEDAHSLKAMQAVITDLQMERGILREAVVSLQHELQRTRVKMMALVSSGEINESKMGESLKLINQLIRASV